MFPEFDSECIKVYLEPLNPQEAKEAILKPLKELRVGYAPKFVDNVLVPGLIGQATGGTQIEPPHLQIVCSRLYDAACARANEGEIALIDATLYDNLGGAQGILQTYLDDTVKQSAGNDLQRTEIIRSMLKLMIQPSGTRKFVTLSELTAGVPDVSAAEVELLTRKLQEDRVIEPRILEQQTTYSLSHEFMVSKVQSWYDKREIERKKAREILERGLAEWRDYQRLLDQKQVEKINEWLKGEIFSEDANRLLAQSQQANEERAGQEQRIEQLNTLEEDIKRLKLERELEVIDRAWENEKENFKIKHQDGTSELISGDVTVSQVIIPVFALIFFLGFSLLLSFGGGIFAVAGVSMAVFCVWSAIRYYVRHHDKWLSYQAVEENYLQKRRSAKEELNLNRRSGVE